MGLGDHHILIIEDELPIRRFLRASLGSEGYRVSEAPTGALGLQMATAQPPDLIILDLGLPDMDGQDVLLRLREWCTAPIIVLSARDQEPQKIKAGDHAEAGGQGADSSIFAERSLGTAGFSGESLSASLCGQPAAKTGRRSRATAVHCDRTGRWLSICCRIRIETVCWLLVHDEMALLFQCQ